MVTGASSGLGKAVARLLAEEGMQVVAVARNIAGLEKEREDNILPVKGDVSDRGGILSVIEDAWHEFGGIDYVVNAAGVIEPASLEDATEDVWRRQLDINLSGSFYVAREAAIRMKERGKGSIVLIGSELSLIGAANFVPYCASKAGLTGLTKAMAHELAPNVRINCVCPGPIDTPMMEAELVLFGGTAEVRKAAVDRIPAKRFASPQEIAEFVKFILVDAHYATGSILSVDGGTTAI